jgi:hypothetical protein
VSIVKAARDERRGRRLKCFCANAGEEDAGPRSEVEGRGAEVQGKVRSRVAGDKPVQPQVHGGHDRGFRQMPGDGGPKAELHQSDPV